MHFPEGLKEARYFRHFVRESASFSVAADAREHSQSPSEAGWAFFDFFTTVVRGSATKNSKLVDCLARTGVFHPNENGRAIAREVTEEACVAYHSCAGRSRVVRVRSDIGVATYIALCARRSPI
ncbi:hypothetical protein GCM10020218_024370 [Dactylosporangium vinaceum]